MGEQQEQLTLIRDRRKWTHAFRTAEGIRLPV